MPYPEWSRDGPCDTTATCNAPGVITVPIPGRTRAEDEAQLDPNMCKPRGLRIFLSICPILASDSNG